MTPLLPEYKVGTCHVQAPFSLVLPHALLPARVLGPISYVLPRLEGAWVDHGTRCCRGLLARQQVQLVWVLSLAVRALQEQEKRDIVPTIFDSDATDNHAIVDLAMAM